MPYKFESPQMAGSPPVEQVVPAPLRLSQLPIDPGQMAQVEDSVFGTGEVIFARAAGAIRVYGLCAMLPVWDAPTRTYRYDMTEAPITGNTGRSLYVSQANRALVSGEYAWFMTSGLTPVNSGATVAAGATFGVAAVGQAGANVAGRQVLNAQVVTPATQTVVKAMVTGAIGENVIGLIETQGLFVGAYVAGTGIPAGATIASIDPLGTFITISAALTANVAGNLTQTANNGTIFYNVAQLNRAFVQGAIT